MLLEDPPERIMDSTFRCPYCSAKYGVLPSLVGRKVRCHKCENIFSLQYDGTVEKILERSEATAAIKKDPTKKHLKQQERPQARAIKEQTRRIEKLKGNLKQAGEAAASSIASSDALEPKEGKSSAPQKTIPGKKRSAESQPKASPQRAVAAAKMEVPRLMIAMVCIGVIGLGALFYFINFTKTPVEQAIADFTSPVDAANSKHPKRMQAYRDRMWLHSRNGKDEPLVMLDMDGVQLGETFIHDWVDVVSITAPLLEHMKKDRKFAMWYDEKKTDKVQELWSAYTQKANIFGFYELLKEQKIDYQRFDELPNKLAKAGMDRRSVYVVSILLASTLSEEQENLGFGLGGGDEAPTEMQITEFNGTEGLSLTDAGGMYDAVTVDEYCGLVVGFNNIGDKERDIRLLDVRLAQSMSPYYNNNENPLLKLSERIYDNIRRSESRKRKIAEQ